MILSWYRDDTEAGMWTRLVLCGCVEAACSVTASCIVDWAELFQSYSAVGSGWKNPAERPHARHIDSITTRAPVANFSDNRNSGNLLLSVILRLRQRRWWRFTKEGDGAPNSAMVMCTKSKFCWFFGEWSDLKSVLVHGTLLFFSMQKAVIALSWSSLASLASFPYQAWLKCSLKVKAPTPKE